MLRKKAPVIVNPIIRHPDEHRVSLDGSWYGRLDEDDVGLQQKWYQQVSMMPERVNVPGCLQGQGFGNSGTDDLADYHLQVRVNRSTYAGVAWYGKTFSVPESWQGEQVWLNFGGASPTAQVWINGEFIGENHYPFISFGFNITTVVKPGENTLAVRISEEDRELAFAFNFVSKWSGIYRSVELTATRRAAIDELIIQSDADTGLIQFKLKVENCGVDLINCSLGVIVSEENSRLEVFRHGYALTGTLALKDGQVFSLNLDNHKNWSPDDPFLYRFEFVLKDTKGICDARIERSGFVSIKANKKHITINGKPYYMRGGDEWMRCTETVSPDTNRAMWRKGLGTIRSFGYNYIRCQSTLPNPEYMDVADEVGLVIQSELGMLGAISGNGAMHAYAWPQPNAEYYQRLLEQWILGVKRDVNRPSCMIYNMSNELAGNLNRTEYSRIAWKCYRETKALKPGAMVIWTDGGFNESLPADFVNDQAAINEKTEKPVIQHEYQWWTSYPDIRIAGKYTGGCRPFAQDIAYTAAFRQGVGHLLCDFAEVSQHLQFIEAKGKMERCRRDHATLAGINHFSSKDCGASPQGMIDEFYDKKLIDAHEWLKTNGDTVVMCSLEFKTRCYTSGDSFECTFSVSDFSHPAFDKPQLTYSIGSGHDTYNSGVLMYDHKPYIGCDAGRLSIRLPVVHEPKEMVLRVCLTDDAKRAENDWKIWVFPAGQNHWDQTVRYATKNMSDWIHSLNGQLESFQDDFSGMEVLITDYIDEKILDFIKRGGRVLFAAGEGIKRAFQMKWSFNEGRYYFSNAACYPFLEDGQHGTLIKPHAMFGDFPYDKYADLQFYRMIAESAPIDIEQLGLNDAEPIMRMIHNYQVARPLAELLERSYGEGLLVITSLDLNQNFPEAQSLFNNIIKYMLNAKRLSCSLLHEKAIEKLLFAGKIMD